MGHEVRVKICGITSVEDGILCAGEGAEMLGFVLYPGSKRYIPLERAVEVIKGLPAGVTKVAVVVNPGLKEINNITRSGSFGMIQLHGEESPEFCAATSLPVIKAFRVHPGFDFSMVQAYGGAIPLFDSFSKEERGGTGKEFDHSLIPRHFRGKFILSGGLSPENVVEAVKKTLPMAVDLSSSLEAAPGRKDPEKVKRFFDILRKETLI